MVNEMLRRAQEALDSNEAPYLDPAAVGEMGPFAELVNRLIQENRALRQYRQSAIDYIRDKINQLLVVMGTVPLRPEELDERSLFFLDPLGVIAGSFGQILEHLRDTNRRLEMAGEEIRAIFEAVGGGILVLNREMRIRSFNTSFREMFVQQQGDPIGELCHKVVCGMAAPSLRCPAARVLTTGKAAHLADWRIGRRQFNIVATPVRDPEGRTVNVVMLYLDITAHKEAEASLAAEKERLSVTLSSIAEGVITTDIDGRITLMNKVAEELTGWQQQDAVGKPYCEVFWAVSAEIRKQCIDLPKEVLAGDRTVQRLGDVVLIAADGVERLIATSAAPIRALKGEIIGVVLVFRDITEERQREKEIQNARRLESLGLLAGGIAHDFNNLLTGILGNITLAELEVAPGNQLAERLVHAEKACLRARSLTQQLLTFSRGGAPVRKTASIRELLTDTALFASRGTSVDCEFRIAEDLWAVEVDEGQVAQVINNLVLNAVQAMPDGGTITVRAENVTLGPAEISALKKGRYVKISIIDHGVGIPEGLLGRIFDPYFTTKPTGSGLGLASSYAIIKKHEGHLAVESKQGKGSTFTIFLAASVAAPKPELEGESGAKPFLGGRVLVMDDEEVIRILVTDLLHHFGFEVSVASNGEEALAMYQKAMAEDRRYDLVIMDLTVPGGMGGKETIPHLLAIDPNAKAIVSSGYSMDDVMSAYQDYGFRAVVPKPYRTTALLDTIRAVLAS